MADNNKKGLNMLYLVSSNWYDTLTLSDQINIIMDYNLYHKNVNYIYCYDEQLDETKYKLYSYWCKVRNE